MRALFRQLEKQSIQLHSLDFHHSNFVSLEIIDSKIGPNVSIGANSKIISSEIKNTIIQSNCNISGASFNNSILGNHVDYDSNLNIINIGDYSKFK